MSIVQSEPKKLYVDWNHFNKNVFVLANKIKQSGFDFDQVVFIPRGGMFVGDALTRIFKKPYAVTVASSYTDSHEQTQLMVSDHITMNTKTLGKKVLLVDDLVDSGKTIMVVKNMLKTRYKVEEIKTAVLFKKSCSKFDPDYYADDIKEGVWIYLPFECWEDPKYDPNNK